MGDLNGKVIWTNPNSTSSVYAALSRKGYAHVAAGCIEGMDIQLLPSSFKGMERTLGFTPSALGALASGQAVMQCISAPFWGALADGQIMTRRQILILGTFVWGVVTTLIGCVSQLGVMFAMRCINGVALATLMPISQSLIAEICKDTERGRAFGVIQFALNSGQILSALLATPLSEKIIYDIHGWRVSFAIVGALSLVLCLALFLFMHEPKHHGVRGQVTGLGVFKRVWGEGKKLFSYLRIPTFIVLVLQGLFGNISWSALNFLTMWFQYTGLSDGQAAILLGTCVFCGGCGAIFGGYVGDWMTSHCSRWHARPAIAQMSVFLTDSCACMMMLLVPRSDADRAAKSFWSFFTCMIVLGLVGQWAGVATNRPIMVELVPAESRASIVSWLTAFEGSGGSLIGAPLVGYLAEKAFGYNTSAVNGSDDIPLAVKAANLEALSRAILYMTVIPWLVCLVLYSALHCTYRRDVAIQRKQEGMFKEGRVHFQLIKEKDGEVSSEQDQQPST